MSAFKEKIRDDADDKEAAGMAYPRKEPRKSKRKSRRKGSRK